MNTKTKNEHQKDDEMLTSLKGTDEFLGHFGVSRVQRTFKWEYRRAYAACERAIKSGVMCQSPENELLLRFS
ncbi:hypothetical protein QTV49_004884 [Vibrio vulnificus]|nr:hypothetical protein [Vibrio vulnificus]